MSSDANSAPSEQGGQNTDFDRTPSFAAGEDAARVSRDRDADPAAVPARDPYPYGVAALSLAIFGLIGASIALAVATFLGPSASFGPFYDHNDVDSHLRMRLFIGLLGGAVLGGGAAFLRLLFTGRRGVLRLRRTADLLLPFGLCGLLPSLFSYDPWSTAPLTFLVELTLATLLFERALRRSFAALPLGLSEAWRAHPLSGFLRQRFVPVTVVAAGSLAYAIYFSYFTILNHHRLNTTGFDLGINVNWCYNALHGHPERSTVLFGTEGGHFLGNHAIFAMALWLPIFALKPGAEILLIVQATMAGAAALSLYAFASTQIPRWSAVAVAFGYLMYAPLHGPNFYDFHELIPPLFFHFLLFYAIARERYWLATLLVPVLWAFREDVAVGIVVLGVFLAVTGARPRFGLVLAGISALWFVGLKFFVMPLFWQTWFAAIYKDLQVAGDPGYASVVQTILINPAYFLKTMLKEEKVIYFLHMFAPVVLLPTRNPALFLLAIPGFAFSLLTTGYGPTLSIAFQYTCHSIPYIFAATVLMLRRLGQRERGTLQRRAAVGALLLGVLSHSYVFGAVLQHNTFVGGFSRVEFTMTTAEQRRYRTIAKMAAMIPVSASVAATENEVPHVAARLNAYTLKDGPSSPDYVLINAERSMFGRTQDNLHQMFAESSYGLVTKGNGLYLFKRDFESPETESALRALHLKPKHK